MARGLISRLRADIAYGGFIMTESQNRAGRESVPPDAQIEPLAIANSRARRRRRNRALGSAMAALIVAAALFAPGRGASGAEQGRGSAPPVNGSTNSFPDLNEVFQGRAFKTKLDRDVFFLRRIREAYPAQWGALLDANIIVSDYVQAPEKLLRFVEALGTALAGTDDVAASTSLAAITSDPAFYANTNAYRPEILRAAAGALIKIGPRGRQALADSFSEGHYRTDSVSLEVLAEAVGEAGVSDARLTAALASTTFRFTATNGGSYPRCTRQVTRSLLSLPGGLGAVGTHLNAK